MTSPLPPTRRVVTSVSADGVSHVSHDATLPPGPIMGPNLRTAWRTEGLPSDAQAPVIVQQTLSNPGSSSTSPNPGILTDASSVGSHFLIVDHRPGGSGLDELEHPVDAGRRPYHSQ